MTDQASSHSDAEPIPIASCPTCDSLRIGAEYRAREMMFGTREEFKYLECAQCGTLRIARIPRELGRYYTGGYYSFTPPPVHGAVKGWLRRMRNRGAIRGDRAAGRLLSRFMPYPERGVGDWVRRSGIGPESRILDVGCGAGLLLVDLADAGFRELLGIDPYLPETVRYANGVEVRRETLEDVRGEFDLVMLHHVLEHVASPVELLRGVARRLAPGGTALVRLPTVSSEAWERYREQWVQLDPPRHLFVPSRRGMEALVERAGLSIREARDDSTDFQFTGSEGYLRDIPLQQQVPPSRNGRRRLMRRAEALNRRVRGDQVAYYLERMDS